MTDPRPSTGDRTIDDGDRELHESPLLGRHVGLGARLIEFADWQMPVQYRGIVEEHQAVRSAAGLFDLSHMGELWVIGADAGDALAAAVVSDPRTLVDGRAQYSLLCTADGGVIDDLIIYRLEADRYLVVANAANATRVSDALAERFVGWKVLLDDRSLATGLVAIQGPRSLDILAPRTDLDLSAIRYYGAAEGTVAGAEALVARTGYTGEDGFEVFVDAGDAGRVWDALIDAGAAHGLLPIGLGARDTLRLEAGMPLYGNELDRSTNPVEAGLGRVVKLDKDGGFVGREALARVVRDGPAKRLVGLVVEGRGIARHGYPVLAGDRRTGVVTSGAPSPTLGVPIAMAYVAPGDAEPGTMLDVEIRDRRVPARVVELPFYRRQR
jgi:aminomethyltransferase